MYGKIANCHKYGGLLTGPGLFRKVSVILIRNLGA